MALDVKKGSFTFASTDSGTKQIRSVGFVGKALVLWAGRGAAEDTWAAHAALTLGFATESGQASAAMLDEDALGTSAVYRGKTTARAIAGLLSGSAGFDYELTPAATLFVTDGFDLDVTNAPAADVIVHYLVLGGSDVTNAAVATGTLNGSTVDVTLGFQPDLCFVIGMNRNASTQGAQDPGSNAVSIGFGVAKSATERAHMIYGADDAAGSMNIGTVLEARAYSTVDDSSTVFAVDRQYDLDSLVNWPADGVRLTQIAGAGGDAAQEVYVLGIEGSFQSKIALASSPTSNGNQDLDAGFPPKLSMFFSDNLAAHVGLDTSTSDLGGVGLGSFDGTAQGLVDIQQDDGNTNSVAKSVSDTSAVLRLTGPGATPTDLGVGVASYPSGNTVRVAWTGVGATARQFAWLALGAGGSVAYSLDCQPGSYAITGTAASPVSGRMVNAAAGAYTLTGVASTTAAGRVVSADPGSYALTGIAATLAASRLFNAAPGAYAVTGAAATLARGVFLNAETGSYAVTGNVAGLFAGRSVNAAPGTYAVTGSAATLAASRLFNAQPGTYAITGSEVGLDVATPGQYTLTAEPAVYALTGAAATIVASRLFRVDPGTFAVTGAAATVGRQLALPADPGVYTLTGVAVTFINTRALAADPGSYTLTGFVADLETEGQAPNLAPHLTGWIATPNTGGRLGSSLQGRLRFPRTGGVD